MRSPPIVLEPFPKEFWTVARDCLREFHGMESETNRQKAGQLRKRILSLSGEAVELFHHAEPSDFTCDLAGSDLRVGGHAERDLHLGDTQRGFSYPPQPAPVQPLQTAAPKTTRPPAAKSVPRAPAKVEEPSPANCNL